MNRGCEVQLIWKKGVVEKYCVELSNLNERENVDMQLVNEMCLVV